MFSCLSMKFYDNKQYSNPKILRNTKEEQNKHGPLQQLEVGSGAMEEYVSSADDRPHPPNNNGLTISMKESASVRHNE